MDLLGYGTQIAAAGLNPLDPNAVDARERLIRFSNIVKKHSNRSFPSLLVNDGAAYFRNLSFRGKLNTLDFVNAIVRAHYAVRNADRVGARTVVSVGFRDKAFVSQIEELEELAVTFAEKVTQKIKPLQSVILDALMTTSAFNQVPALNSNYAFTKSYIVDTYGSKGGFSGPEIFIESGMFSETLPNNYVKARVNCEIFSRQYTYLNVRRMKLGPEHVLDTVSIAKYLASDENVFQKLFAV